MELKLYPYQKHAVQSAAQEILIGGSAGPGKSYFLRSLSIILALEIPGIQIYLFRRLHRELVRNHVYGSGGYLAILKELVDAGDVSYNKTDGAFVFYNGAQIILCHAQYEDDVYTYLGTDINVLLIDEATQFSEMMLRFLRSRVRLGGLKIPDKWKQLLPKIFYATNPGGQSHTYLKQGFVDHGPKVVFQAPDEDGGMLREYVPALYTDNKVMLKNDPRYRQRLMGLGDPKLIEAYLNGSWDVLTDGMFSQDWDAFVHVMPPFAIPHTWTIDRGHDHGTSAPAATLYFAESDGSDVRVSDKLVRSFPAKSLFIIGEVYFADKHRKGLNLTPMELADRMVKYEKDEGLKGRVQPGPADNSIFYAAPGFASIADLMAKRGIKFIRSDKTAGSRKRGVVFIHQMLSAAKHRLTDVPHIYVFANCFHTKRTLPNLQRSETDQDDVDTEGEDHIYDVIRYRVLKTKTAATEARVIGL